ncbi:Uncharacterised protein [Acinetobacter baumannii]|nr:Uncharacterised protein [Acinetobacter baumannii]
MLLATSIANVAKPAVAAMVPPTAKPATAPAATSAPPRRAPNLEVIPSKAEPNRDPLKASPICLLNPSAIDFETSSNWRLMPERLNLKFTPLVVFSICLADSVTIFSASSIPFLSSEVLAPI